MIGSSVGFGKALSLMVVKFVSPMGLGVPFLGGVMGTSIFWFAETGTSDTRSGSPNGGSGRFEWLLAQCWEEPFIECWVREGQ